jgi:hypothetical protein
MEGRFLSGLKKICVGLGGIALVGLGPGANAPVTTITINNTQSAFGGASFGSVGTYEVITGTFTDEVDPDDPHNAVIVDIEHGPKNANGTVGFTADFQIIRPTNLANSAHRVIYDVPNRGGTGALSTLNGDITATGTPITAGGNTAVPPSAGAAGTGFLMNMGWSIVEVGWDLTAPQGGRLFGVTLPVAKHKDGSAITGPTTEELVVDIGTTPADLPLTYPPASLDQSKAMLTVRENYGDTPQVVPACRLDVHHDMHRPNDLLLSDMRQVGGGRFRCSRNIWANGALRVHLYRAEPEYRRARLRRDPRSRDLPARRQYRRLRHRQSARRRCEIHLHDLQLAALPHYPRLRPLGLQRSRYPARREYPQMGG